MPPLPPGKAQLHLTVTEEEKTRIAELALRYEDVPEGWFAVMLLRYGLRHYKRAWHEMTDRAEGGSDDEEGTQNA